MLVGDTELPIQIAILFLTLLLSLGFNLFLFTRGHQSYSIKYELMLSHKIFRTHQLLTGLIEWIYKCFFALPFILLFAIAVLRAMVTAAQFATIAVNGLIVLLIVYPFKTSFFYAKQIILWLLAITSQLISLYLKVDKSAIDPYGLLSCIFYPINALLFSLALLAAENNYWEMGKAVEMCQQELAKVYPAFVEAEEQTIQIEEKQRKSDRLNSVVKREVQQKFFKNIPFVFNGGLYGTLCRVKRRWVQRLLYFLSLCILGLFAWLVYFSSGSSLGLIGLLTNFIYDLFVLTFNVLHTPQRSLRNVFALVFIGRLLSFVFGRQLWIIGYCALYFLAGIFVGGIIINSRLPLRTQSSLKNEEINAFRTPQFVLFILSAQIFGLVMAASFGVGGNQASVSYSDTISIPIWQFALLIVIATWVVILFLASTRMVSRSQANLHDPREYFFGHRLIRQFHVYMLVTYLLIIGLGLYCYFFLLNSTAFFACVFLPLVHMVLEKMFAEWVKNQFQALADIPQYNSRVDKMKRVIEKKEMALRNQKKGKGRGEAREGSMLRIMVRGQDKQGLEGKDSAEVTRMAMNVREVDVKSEGEHSTESFQSEIDNLQSEKGEWKQLMDWRSHEGTLSLFQLWGCFTRSDKWLILLTPVLLILFTAFILATYLGSQSLIGFFIVILLLSLLSLLPFYRYIRSFKDLTPAEYVLYELGWIVAVIYWSFYNHELLFTMLWAAGYVGVAVGLVAYAVAKKVRKQLIYWLLLNIAMTLLFVCLFLGFTQPAVGAGLVSILIAMACVGAIPIAYSYIQGYVPTIAKIISVCFIVGGITTISVLGFLLDIVSNFAVFSFVMGCVYIILVVIGSVIYFQKESGKYDSPHVYSAFGEPIYRFDSASEQLKSSKGHKVIFDIASVTLVVYAATVSLIFESKEYAIYALGLYCCATFYQNILFALKSYNELAQSSQMLTKSLIEAALHDLTNKYMLDFKENRYSQQIDELKQQKKQSAATLTSDAQLNDAWLQIAKLNVQYIKNSEEQQKFLYFWILLIELHLFAARKSTMVQLINQVKQIETELIEYGIFLQSVNFALDFQTKYELLSKEIEKLHPFDFVNFQRLLTEHQQQMHEKNEDQKKKGEEIQREQKNREDEIYDKMKNDLNKTAQENIKEFHKRTKDLPKGRLFVDEEFPADENVLGGLASYVESWRRPKTGESLVTGGFSPYDVKQGSIGDCYLISSLGVLGQKWIKPALGIGQDGKEIWNNRKGAYMVRFYKFLKEVYITIDDFLPINNYDEFVFARSEDPMEIWPCILEKAYAKLYSGYDKIVQGKCHRVFAELTGGFPSEILVDGYKTNPNGLWQKLINAKNNNYLLAAGSPPNAQGDSVASKRGIVQGHAYSVLDAKEIEQNKLIKLKNPHGSGGAEWNGDFSDESEFMTKRMMQLLSHQKADDGIFWMKLEDFIHEYKSLYICAVFDEKWLKIPPIEGSFTLQNSYGTPNLSSQTFRNPQFGITATKRCTLFVNLLQQSKNSLLGQNFIYMRIQRNDGKRICKQNVQADKLCGSALRPINSVSLSNEVILEADYYPYTFTLYISCKNEGDLGKYVLEMYCNDWDIELIPDEKFDRGHFQ